LVVDSLNAQHAVWTNNPLSVLATTWTHMNLDMRFLNFNMDYTGQIFTMAAISRAQQLDTQQPSNTQYRIVVSGNTAAQANTGKDHRGDLRRNILLYGAVPAVKGSHYVQLEVCISWFSNHFIVSN